MIEVIHEVHKYNAWQVWFSTFNPAELLYNFGEIYHMEILFLAFNAKIR
jgi:hypothetical protein